MAWSAHGPRRAAAQRASSAIAATASSGKRAEEGKEGEAQDGSVFAATADVALAAKLNAVFRVIWSGKWAVASPHAILGAVWQLLPQFRGYQQQDAHELLIGLEDQLAEELKDVRWWLAGWDSF